MLLYITKSGCSCGIHILALAIEKHNVQLKKHPCRLAHRANYQGAHNEVSSQASVYE